VRMLDGRILPDGAEAEHGSSVAAEAH
jgi:hypothetical protein